MCHLFHSIVWGFLGLAIAFKLLRYWRYGCGGCGHRRWGHHHGGWRGFGPRSMMGLMSELHLSREQRDQIWKVFKSSRTTFEDLRTNAAEGREALLRALGEEYFDRSAVEATLEPYGQVMANARDALVDRVEELHKILTEEQRERLRSLLERRR